MRRECFCADGFIDAHELNSILQDLGTTLNPGDLRDMLREMENMAPGAGDSAPMPDSLAPGAPRCPSLPRCDALRSYGVAALCASCACLARLRLII